MNTNNAVQSARNCYVNMIYTCPGDSGDIKCFFCPACVLSLPERIMNLADYEIITLNLKKCDVKVQKLNKQQRLNNNRC